MAPALCNILKVFAMKTAILATAIFFVFGITACGNGNGNAGTVDTVINPADHTNAAASDSTKPANAPGLDTVAGGQSTSSGIKDSSKKR